MKNKEIVEFTSKLLLAFRWLAYDYRKHDIDSGYEDAKVGDWGIAMTGRITIESIIKITKADRASGEYEGVDLLGITRKWGNQMFYKLPEACTEALDGKYRNC